MVDMVQFLQMFVRLAMQLEVGLQIGLVCTQLANKIAGDDD